MAASLHKKVKSLIRNETRKFVFDVGEIEGITSNGLGILMVCQTSVINSDGQIKLTGVNKTVQQFFSITNLDTYFDIYTSEKTLWKVFSKNKDITCVEILKCFVILKDYPIMRK